MNPRILRPSKLLSLVNVLPVVQPALVRFYYNYLYNVFTISLLQQRVVQKKSEEEGTEIPVGICNMLDEEMNEHFQILLEEEKH